MKITPSRSHRFREDLPVAVKSGFRKAGSSMFQELVPASNFPHVARWTVAPSTDGENGSATDYRDYATVWGLTETEASELLAWLDTRGYSYREVTLVPEQGFRVCYK
jgi:hypothetical protein